jgi:hypothetical protein
LFSLVIAGSSDGILSYSGNRASDFLNKAILPFDNSAELDRGFEYYKVYSEMRTSCFLILAFGITSVFALAKSANAETLTVTTKQNALRESCKFFAPIKVTVHYNDVLDVISQSGEWYQASFKGTQGCIHKSAVEKKSISLSKISGSGSQSASGDEVAIAGKGFNPQVEAAYKRQNPSLNFQAVNTIENYRVSENKLVNFIQGGRLNLE